MSRYKAAADHYESAEDDLKAEKRRLQREVSLFSENFAYFLKFSDSSIAG